MISLSFILHAFHAFQPRFWVFLKYMGILKIDECFVKFLGWVLCFWCYMLMHFITFAFSQCFMHYRCVFLCWNLCAVRFGWGWTYDASLFLHVTCSCIIHAHIPFLFHIWYSLLMLLFCLSPPLSLDTVHGTQAQNHFISKPFSFQGIFFWPYPLSRSVPW